MLDSLLESAALDCNEYGIVLPIMPTSALDSTACSITGSVLGTITGEKSPFLTIGRFALKLFLVEDAAVETTVETPEDTFGELVDVTLRGEPDVLPVASANSRQTKKM